MKKWIPPKRKKFKLILFHAFTNRVGSINVFELVHQRPRNNEMHSCCLTIIPCKQAMAS